MALVTNKSKEFVPECRLMLAGLNEVHLEWVCVDIPSPKGRAGFPARAAAPAPWQTPASEQTWNCGELTSTVPAGNVSLDSE